MAFPDGAVLLGPGCGSSCSWEGRSCWDSRSSPACALPIDLRVHSRRDASLSGRGRLRRRGLPAGSFPFFESAGAARHFGIPYDSRRPVRGGQGSSRTREGRLACRVLPPGRASGWRSREILPLGGISRVQTVFCNEMGRYVLYSSDEHGFINRKESGRRERSRSPRWGDSFTQGSCVESGQNFVARLRPGSPATLNLGMLGKRAAADAGGPAGVLPWNLRPRIVLWVLHRKETTSPSICIAREKAGLPDGIPPSRTSPGPRGGAKPHR
jgi:hypothetical protein